LTITASVFTLLHQEVYQIGVVSFFMEESKFHFVGQVETLAYSSLLRTRKLDTQCQFPRGIFLLFQFLPSFTPLARRFISASPSYIIHGISQCSTLVRNTVARATIKVKLKVYRFWVAVVPQPFTNRLHIFGTGDYVGHMTPYAKNCKNGPRGPTQQRGEM